MISAGFAVGFALAAMTIAIVSVFVAAAAIIDVHAFRRSTHQIQYMPVDQATKISPDPVEKMMAEHDQTVYDNLASYYPGKDETV